MSVQDNLKEALAEAAKSAAKSRDQVRLDTIRSVQSAVRYKEIDKKAALTEPEIIAVINTLCKQRRESIDQFTKGNRPELAAKEAHELEILEKYLPVQLPREEIEKTVKQVITDLGAKSVQDLGTVMKEAIKRLSGQADGRVVSEIVRTCLSSPTNS